MIIVKVDSANPSDTLNAVNELGAKGIDHLDIVIANATIIEDFPRVADVSIDDLHRNIDVDVYGVVRLFQATIPLPRKDANPKFVTMGPGAGSIGVRRPTYYTSNWQLPEINYSELASIY